MEKTISNFKLNRDLSKKLFLNSSYGYKTNNISQQEIKEMKAKQREFEELRNKELMEVQTLEDQEKRREVEIVIFTIIILEQSQKSRKTA